MLKRILLACLSLAMVACWGKGVRKGGGTAQVDRIRGDAELLLSGGDLEHFLERNPGYNPSWYAELVLSSPALLSLEREVEEKRLLPVDNLGAIPSDVVWWSPADEVSKYRYMTSRNGVVLLVISKADDGRGSVFMKWSSP